MHSFFYSFNGRCFTNYDCIKLKLNIMEIKPIKTEQDYQQALERREEIFDAKKGTKEGDDVDEEFAPDMNQAYIDCTLHYYQSLLKTGLPMENIQLHVKANEIHHEKYWADHFVEFLHFTLED